MYSLHSDNDNKPVHLYIEKRKTAHSAKLQLIAPHHVAISAKGRLYARAKH